MKKMLLIALATLFVSSFAYSADYIGLYADPDHNICTLPASSFTMYVLTWMSDNAMSGVEFRCVMPPIATAGTVVNGPDVSFTVGTFTSDFSVTFNTCQVGWKEVCHVPITVTPGSGVIRVEKGEWASDLMIIDCDWIEIPISVANHMYIGEPCITIGTQDATWGTIKSLF